MSDQVKDSGACPTTQALAFAAGDRTGRPMVLDNTSRRLHPGHARKDAEVRLNARDLGAFFQKRSVLRCGDFRVWPEAVIAIPVCNESERIVDCIDALSAATSQGRRFGVVLMVNNSTDASAEKAHAAMTERGMTGLIVDVTLGPQVATAGWARRLAMDVAAQWVRPDGVLMTTDADGRVATDWADANLALLANGAHLVCGRIAADAAEAALLPASIARSGEIESEYTVLSIELDARLDPRPHNPWPHHGLASGASLAIRARDYCAVGRMQPLPCSEDRAFAALVERHDLCVHHSDLPLVTVSCRLEGRARGGMADAISARIADPDSFADQRLFPAAITARRATYRRTLRTAWGGKSNLGLLLSQLGVNAAHMARAGRATTFGAFWEEIEAGATTLAAARMRPSDLVPQLAELRQLVAQARLAT